MASTGVKIDEFWKKIWAQNGLRIILVCDLGISVIISIVRGPSFKVLQTAVKLLDAARWKHHILLSKLNKKWNLTYYLLLLIIYGYITITIRYIWLGHCFFSGPSDTFRPSNLPNVVPALMNFHTSKLANYRHPIGRLKKKMSYSDPRFLTVTSQGSWWLWFVMPLGNLTKVPRGLIKRAVDFV